MKALLSIFAALTIATLSVDAQLVKIKQMVTVAEKTAETDPKELIINSVFCKVNIQQAEGDKSVINGKLEAMEAHDDYVINIDDNGQTLTLSFDVPTDAKSSYAGEFNVSVANDVKVIVKATSGNVTLNNLTTCNADIETVKGKITGNNVSGNVKATTQNGDIKFTKADGTLELSTSNGKVDVIDSKGSLTFDTSDGATTVNNFSGKLNAKTIAGTQTYDNITDCDFKLQGSTGAIKISNAEIVLNASLKMATLNLYKVKGEFHITSEKGSIISSGSSNGVTLTASSDFTTTEGKINLTLINKKDELSFDLEHAHKGDIGLIAKGERTTKKQLKCGKGPIKITGRTNTGTQTYR